MSVNYFIGCDLRVVGYKKGELYMEVRISLLLYKHSFEDKDTLYAHRLSITYNIMPVWPLYEFFILI